MIRRDFIKTTAALAVSPFIPDLLPVNKSETKVDHEFIKYLKNNFVGRKFKNSKNTFKILPWYQDILEKYDQIETNERIIKARQVGTTAFNFLYLTHQVIKKNKNCAFICRCPSVNLSGIPVFDERLAELSPSEVGDAVHALNFWQFDTESDFIVTSQIDDLRGRNWDYIYIDEADYIKNEQRYDMYYYLINQSKTKIIIASTLAPNNTHSHRHDRFSLFNYHRMGLRPRQSPIFPRAQASHFRNTRITAEQGGILDKEQIDNLIKYSSHPEEEVYARYPSFGGVEI